MGKIHIKRRDPGETNARSTLLTKVGTRNEVFERSYNASHWTVGMVTSTAFTFVPPIW